MVQSFDALMDALDNEDYEEEKSHSILR
ncbi:hypothetical protein ACVPOY_03805 [Staphylococcus aureus]